MKRFMAALLVLCMLFGTVAAFAEDASTGATERWRNRWNREESSETEETENETETKRPSRPSREEKEEEPEEEQEESAESSRDYAELWKEWWEQHRSEGEEPEEDDEDEDDEIAADTGEGPAYVYKDNGFKQYGTIRSLIQYSRPIYLYTTEVLESTLPLETIRRITFVLDPDVFSGSDEGDDDSFVYASERSPEGKTKDGTVFVWVGTAGQGPSSWKDDVEEDLNSGYREDQYYEYEIQVSSETVDGQTTFMLTAYPALEKGMKFAYSRDGSSPMTLDGSVFTAEKEGEYRFYLLSSRNRTLARSARFRVDFSAVPEIPAEPEIPVDPEAPVDPELPVDPEAPVEPETPAGPSVQVTALPDAETGVTVFSLTALPALEEGMYFGVIVDGGTIQALNGDIYTAQNPGAYRFVLMDAYGTVLAQSEPYVITMKAPEEEEGDEGEEKPSAPTVVEYELEVDADDYTPDQECQPTFHLTAHPELEEGMRYAVSIDGSVVAPMEGSSFAPEFSGKYRFAILSAKNIVLAYSAAYDVTCPAPWEDEKETAVEYELEVQADNYRRSGACMPTFTLTAHPEAHSGLRFAVSRDGGDLTVLSANTFSPTESGEYRFYLLSENESELARSSRYSVTYGKEEIKSGETAGFETTRRQQNTGRDETGDEEVSFDLLFSEHEVSADGSEKFVYESVADRVEITTRPGANRVEEGIEFEVLTRYREGSRATSAPEFRLYGLAGDDQYVYGVRMDDSGYTTLPSGRYTATMNGEYTLTFAIIDPETQAALQEKSYRMNVAIETEEEEETPEAGETPDTETTYEHTLNVSASEYDSAAWISTPPAFTLSCGTLDVDGMNYAYAVSIDGADAVACVNPYVPTKSVSSSLTFSIIGADGTVYAQSESQPLMLDITAPLLTITLLDGYQMNIVAGDSHSGGCTLTVDGQAISSSAEGADGVYTWTVAGSEAITYAVGSIVVEDAAGNQSSNSVAVTLALGSGTQAGAGSMGALGSVSGSFSSGRGGSDGRSVSHSESTTSVVIAYNAVELVVDDGSMNSLVIGDETLDLSLSRDGADASFTAAFASNGAENDTLILTASDADASARYNWRFTGTVYKKLAASGVDYMVLKVGDSVTSLSTAGFSAGIRYNMYRAQGLASKAFTYDVQMGAPSFGISVTVEGDTYALSSDPGAEYYYYDVYHGPMDQLHLQGN
ncbi:MAG: hypothetical protein PUD16_01870 [bacterium]|nr:hypothetical protein [bacterium]